MSRRGEERGRAVNEDRTVDQARIVRALSRPEAFPWPSGDVIVHETHGSWVFVAGDRAAKLKKSVKTPFFDYSTVERRRELCRREVEINRELAPEIYLGTRAVVDEGGAVRVASQEDDELEGALDTLVIMRRIHPEQLLDAHVREGRASEREIDAVVDLLVPFYERARADASIARHGTPEAVLAPVIGNFAETEHLVGRHTSEERFARLKSAQLGFVTLYRDLF
ncbi:MAG TPA: hypothetical protein VK116_00845, partial [Planctomycetota bacterium]|nr:hypothetical protein [Planctomycetota bacterium]